MTSMIPANARAISQQEPAASVGEEPAHLARVEDLLCRELDGYRDLLDAMLAEKEILTRNRTEELPAILDEQRRIVQEIRDVEPERAAALAALGAELGLAGQVTLRALGERLEGASRERVGRMRQALSNVVPQVDRVNRINVMLIRNSMTYIGATVKAILEEASPGGATYAAGGGIVRTERPASWTDRRA